MNTVSLRSAMCQGAAILLLATILMITGCANKQDPKNTYSTKDLSDSAWLAGVNAPPKAKTLYAMAKIFAAQGRNDEAMFVLKKIVQEHPTFLPAYADMATLHIRARRVDSAIEVLTAGLVVSPKDAILLNNVGMCWLVKKQYDHALSMFSQAAASQPGDVRYRANMALALGMSGRYDEALALYAQVLSPADAHYNLAIICEARNDHERAVEARATSERLRSGKVKPRTGAKEQAITKPCPPKPEPLKPMSSGK